MIKIKVAICLSILGLLIVFSCKKYPDGPALSLITKKERVSNSWKINQFKLNGKDTTNFAKSYLFNDYVINIKKNGTYNLTFNTIVIFTFPFNEAGKWVFNENKTKILFTKESGNTSALVGSVSTWEILRLKEKEVWVKQTSTSNNEVSEIHLN